MHIIFYYKLSIILYLLYWTNVFRLSNNNKTFIIFNKDEHHTQVSIHIRHSKESWTVDIPNIPYSHSICHSQNEQWPPQMTMMDLKIHALKKLCLVQHFLFFNFIFNHHEFQIQSPCQWRIDLRTIQNGLPPCFLRFHCLAKDGAAGHLLPVGCRHGRDH